MAGAAQRDGSGQREDQPGEQVAATTGAMSANGSVAQVMVAMVRSGHMWCSWGWWGDIKDSDVYFCHECGRIGAAHVGAGVQQRRESVRSEP